MFEVKCDIKKFSEFRYPWYLDSVKVVSANEERTRFCLEGWILGDSEVAIDMLSIRDEKGLRHTPLTVSRRDVLRKYSASTAQDVSVKPYCGFRSEIDIYGCHFEIGTLVNNDFLTAASIKFILPSVVIGDTGWVFLDKDTNGSVAQYRGLRQVGGDWAARWKRYFSDVGLYLNDRCKFTFLLAPSKEEVMREEYPFARGSLTLVDRYLSAHGESITWPLGELRAEKYLSYDAADTHWSDHGANLAFSKALNALGETDLAKITSQYEVVSIRGDLGDRLTPAVRSVRLKTVLYPNSKLVEDNKIINHGNVKRYVNSDARKKATLLIFGGSSANNFLVHAANIFSEVIFVHTTGSVDKSVIELYKPDFVILQTNQRFIVTPPASFVDISIYSAKKAASLK